AMMRAAAAGGAGGLVAKTVSTRPARDPRPSIRRATGQGLLNCETWSEIPVEEYLDDLREAKKSGVPVIASIGYTPEEVSTLGRLIEREVHPDGFEFSTHYSGASIDPLVQVARSLREAVEAPVWMKVSPGCADIEGLARKASEYVDGFVAVNSYGPVLDFDPETAEPLLGSPGGIAWLSGAPIRTIALRTVHQMAQVTERPIIGVGGVEGGVDAVKLIMAGASLVQVCSAAIQKGHGVYGRIAGEITEWLDEHGYSSVEEIRGRFAPERAQPRPAGSGAATAGPSGDDRRRAAASHLMHIIEESCTGCRACIGRCVQGALFMENEKARVVPENCIGCGYCQDFCPADAMSLAEV
ncbi:MAG: 4Fe-4S binding protein, partial [Spirochaetota bacterium]